MCLDVTLRESVEIHEEDVAIGYTWYGKQEVAVIVAKRNEVVGLVLLETKSVNDMLDFHVEQVNHEHLALQCDHDLALPDTHLLYR